MVLKTSDNMIGQKAWAIGDMVNGTPSLVMIICNHCPYVLFRMPAISQLVKDYNDRVYCIAVNSNDSSKYEEDAPSLCTIDTFCFPLSSFPNLIVPSFSAIIALSFGLRASNKFATLGKPPVISLVLEDSNGILAITSPALIFAPSVTLIIAPEGNA